MGVRVCVKLTAVTSEKLTDRDKKLYNQLVKVDDSLKDTFAMSESTITSSLNTLSIDDDFLMRGMALIWQVRHFRWKIMTNR